MLTLAGIPHTVIVSNADETVTGEPQEQVKELALRKAKAVLLLLNDMPMLNETSVLRGEQKEDRERVGEGTFSKAPSSDAENIPIIIAADTLVYINGKVLGKPVDADEAFAMLRELSGAMHTVYTGVAIIRESPQCSNGQMLPSAGLGGEDIHVFADATRVFFRELSDEEILNYIATGEPFDKAGAYGVQERGAVLVDKVEGDFYTVVGLPIAKVASTLACMGYDIW